MAKSFKVYLTFVVLFAVSLLAAASWVVLPGATDIHWNAVAAFLVLGFFSEASYLKLRVGRAETMSSVAFIPFIASVMLLSTGWAAATAGAAMFGVESLVRRRAPFRVAFNTAQIVVSVSSTSLVFQALGGQPSLVSLSFVPLAVAGAVVTYFLANSAAVAIGVALLHREAILAAWVRIAGASLLYDLMTSLLVPLLAYLYVTWQVAGILMLIVPIYFVRHLYQVSLQLEQVNRDLLELMVKAIEARDPYTSGHSLRVSKISEILARELGLGHKQVDQIRTAALLHDVGKIHEEYAPLLRKEGKLDAGEQALMQTHSTRSAELVSTISAFKGTITEAVKSHHENFDGTGYPDARAGEAIPIGSRIIMIADTIDAMTTDRPYRKALSFERVKQELVKFSGRQFDPSLVELCLKSDAIRTLLESRFLLQGLPSAESMDEGARRRLQPKIPTKRAVRITS